VLHLRFTLTEIHTDWQWAFAFDALHLDHVKTRPTRKIKNRSRALSASFLHIAPTGPLGLWRTSGPRSPF